MSDRINHSYSYVFFLYFTFPFVTGEVMTNSCVGGTFGDYSWFIGCLKTRGGVQFVFAGLHSLENYDDHSISLSVTRDSSPAGVCCEGRLSVISFGVPLVSGRERGLRAREFQCLHVFRQPHNLFIYFYFLNPYPSLINI